MRSRVLLSLMLLASVSGALADSAKKPPKIWNLTTAVVIDLRLAKAGTTEFGRNLVLDDKDGDIALDERLTLRDTPSGVYDARIGLKDGRKCKAPGLAIEPGAIISLEEKTLRDCAK